MTRQQAAERLRAHAVEGWRQARVRAEELSPRLAAIELRHAQEVYGRDPEAEGPSTSDRLRELVEGSIPLSPAPGPEAPDSTTARLAAKIGRGWES